MSAFNTLDDSTGASRIMVLLLDFPEGIGVVDMHNEMKQRYQVGRGATDSSRRELEKAGLIRFEKVDIGAPRKIHAYKLTPLGLKIAEKLKEIENILQE